MENVVKCYKHYFNALKTHCAKGLPTSRYEFLEKLFGNFLDFFLDFFLKIFLNIFWISFEIFWNFFGGFFWKEFFWRNFSRVIFWEKSFVRIFLWGFFERIFLEGFLFLYSNLVEINKELMFLSWFWGNCLNAQWRRRKEEEFLILRSAT